MAEQTKFGSGPGANPGGLRCEEWELLLTDALDGLLSPAETAAFEAHAAVCPACADLLAHARQGREWLGYLHTEPEVPADLVSRILDKTVGASAIPVPLAAGAAQGQVAVAAAVPWRRNFHEMRLLMTVAMAFFSIALTLNLVGVRLNRLSVADLRPATIGSALSRQFYGAQGSVVRFYNNLRFVYQMESRMRELRRDVDTSPARQKSNHPGPSSHNGVNPAPGQLRGTVQTAGGRAKTQDNHAELQPERPHTRQPATEVSDLNSLGHSTAGPRRAAELAGYEGRSLA